jgi:hypothetical protein
VRGSSVRREIALLALLAACGGPQPREPAEVDVGKVYRDFLVAYFSDQGWSPQAVIVRRLTKKDGNLRYLPRSESREEVWQGIGRQLQQKGLAAEAWEDFRSRNHAQHDLTRWMTVHEPAFVVSDGEYGDAEYRALSVLGYGKAPAGYIGGLTRETPRIEFSAVGVSRDKKQAVLYFGILWGGTAGHGGCYLLQRTPKGWRVSAEHGMWVS